MSMDTFVDERDFTLLEHDRYSFFVLHRIIEGNCRLLLSDHENLIICYTGEPYPYVCGMGKDNLLAIGDI